jgi:Predicted ATPase related to phosphate starvation-inducible protein PhoH
MDNLYKGYQELIMDEEHLSQFYANPKEYCANLLRLNPNEYILLQDLSGTTIDVYKNSPEGPIAVRYPTINSRITGTLKPRNIKQKIAMALLQDASVGVKLLRGVYGSGKDYLMLSQALHDIEVGKFQKLVFIRPNVSIKDVPDIGYLKGDAYEKLSWTLGPFYDKVGGAEGVEYLIAQGELELVPLPFIRGRSFENSIVYVCEGQNITTEIAKLLISRVGEGSELWINADTHQTDNKVYDRDNGIIKMIDRLKDDPLFGMVYLDKTERGAIANLANKLDD